MSELICKVSNIWVTHGTLGNGCLPPESVSSLLSAVTLPTWERSEFIATILRLSEELSIDSFTVLVDYLDLWAEGRRESKQKDKRT